MKNIKAPKEYEGIVKEITSLSSRHGINTVFTTFLELLATGFAVYFDPCMSEKMLERFNEIEGSFNDYDKQAYGKIIEQMFICAMRFLKDPKDILGELFHLFNLGSEWNGQYFTSNETGRFMAEVMRASERYGHIEDPTCGSGSLLIACAKVIKSHGENYKNVLFIGKDIDIRCVWMTYIQCCLFGLPAKITHGNSLTNEVWTEWHTPGYWSLVGKKTKGDSIQVCE